MILHQQAPLAPSRVVVLGASGFVGRATVAELGRLGIGTLGLSSADLDLCAPDAVAALRRTIRPSDAIVLISAVTPDRGRDIATLMQNLRMVEAACAFLEESACAHLVYVSSDAVYAAAANPVRETSRCHPSALHGLMHLARERMLAYSVQKSKIPLLCLRPCAIFGAGDTHGSYGPNRFLRSALAEGKITLIGNGEEKRDHVYIDDVARLVAAGLLCRSTGALNVATGRAMSFLEVAETVARLSGRPVVVERLPRSAPITHRHFDTASLRRAFPDFRMTPLEAGVAATLAAMRGGA